MKPDTVQSTAPAPAAVDGDRVIYRRELPDLLGVGTEAVRRYIKAKKLPEPDVDLSPRCRGWKISTLRAAGIRVL